MRPGVLPLASTALLAELVAFLYLPGDAWLVLFPLHGMLVLCGVLLARSSAPGRHIPAACLILLGSTLSLLDAGRLLPDPTRAADEDAVRTALGRDADDALASFRAFLSGEKTLVASLPGSILAAATGREDLFAQLEAFRPGGGRARDELALTVYAPDGEALAWTGEPSVLDPPEARAVVRGTLTQFARKKPLGTRLWTVRTLPGSATGRFIVSEVLLDAPFDPEAWRRRVHLPSRLRAQIRAEFLEGAREDPALQEFLSGGGDRYWMKGAGGTSDLLVPMRSDADDPIGLLTLTAESAAEAAARRARAQSIPRLGLFFAATLALLLAALRAARRAGERERSAMLTLGLLLIALRTGGLGLAPFFSGTALFDYRMFSLPAPLRLAASPGDCLLTSLALLGLAGISAALVRRRGAALLRVGAGVVGVSLALGLFLLTPSWVSDASLNLARSPFQQPIPARLALGWSHAGLALAALLLLLAALARRDAGPLRLRTLAGAWMAAAVASYVMLSLEAAKVPAVTIETSLAPDVLDADANRRDRLLEVLSRATQDPRWETLGSGNQASINRLALDLWRDSSLGGSGTRSALAVVNNEGMILSSFAYGLPDSVFTDTAVRGLPPPDPRAGASPVLAKDSLRVLSLSVPLLRGEVPVAHEGRPIGRLAVLASTEWDNLPFLTLSDPLLRTLGAGHQDLVFPEYFGGAPLFIAYSPSGEVVFPSSEQAAPLPAHLLAAREPLWTTLRFLGNDYKTYLFPTRDGPRAIGYLAPTRTGLAAGLIRALTGCLPLLGIAAAALALLRLENLRFVLSAGMLGPLFAASYYRRLLAVVLVSSLVPLLLLAVIFRHALEQRTREAFEQAGIQAAATVRRFLEDYVESRVGIQPVETDTEPIGAGLSGREPALAEGPPAPAGEPLTRLGARPAAVASNPIRSWTLFWVGRTVHEDIHLFIGEHLVATSRGNTEASGLRTFRLGADVAREMARNRPPQLLSKPGPAGRREALVYAPVRLREGRPDGVLAIPLVLQDRDLSRAGEAVADALLTATFGLGLVLCGVGYLFARRLSVPIGELGAAARRIAGGQLDVRVRPRGRDEIRQLVDAFNSMAVALSEQREDLRRRKDYIEAILLNVTTGVISTSPEGIVRTSNPAASLLLDLPLDLAGMNLIDEMRRRVPLAPLLELWSQPLGGGPSATPRETSIHRRSEEIRLRSVVLPLAEPSNAHAGRIYLVEDVTDVMRSNRLEAWAEMARRIAHEIKNPLTPIQLSAEHLLRVHRDARGTGDVRGAGAGSRAVAPHEAGALHEADAPQDDYDRVLRQCVETILGQVRALREISSDFSAYARLPDLQRQPSDLAEMVRTTLAPYRTAPPGGIRIVAQIDALPSASLDTRVLKRALVNLIENALQAMEGGGLLTVSLARIGAEVSGGFAELIVADTGAGIDAATRARIFEPYFSTRSSGIGLGLAIARRAVEEHGGTIAAESELGMGTRMIIRLPLGEHASAAEQPVADAADEPAIQTAEGPVATAADEPASTAAEVPAATVADELRSRRSPTAQPRKGRGDAGADG